MKCSTCGQDMPDSVGFCGQCGAPVGDPSSLVEGSYARLPRVSFTTAIKLGFERYFTFNGRSTRAEYWWWFLFVLLADAITTVIDMITGTYSAQLQIGLFSSLTGLVLFIPGLALGARRLHDINRTGWWQLMWVGIIFLIPLLVLLWWAIKPSNDGTNKYGPDPRRSTHERDSSLL